MKSSKRKIESARANGARSKGPKTAEGKRRSSYNAIRHGMLSNCVVLSNEDPDAFEAFLCQFVRRFEPLDDVEFGLIEEMAASQWRLRRNWAIETELMDQALDHHPPGPGANGERAATAAAFKDLAARPELHLLNRYEARLHRIYQRALRNLLDLREDARKTQLTPAAEEPAEEPAEIHCGTNPIPISDTPPGPSKRPKSPGKRAPRSTPPPKRRPIQPPVSLPPAA